MGGGGSSPHTRGAPTATPTAGPSARIIPAYAGSTGWRRSRDAGCSDHPRIRGEHIGWAAHQVKITGSSPHTRGARASQAMATSTTTIIPAYAGSTRARSVRSERSWDHPRIRGEHMPWGDSGGQHPGSSPHTRGAHHYRRHETAARDIIPAYAGSTRSGPLWTGSTWDHPRIRGEHGLTDRSSARGVGSSPHTRGAPARRRAGVRRLRIIPAYAGSTARWTTANCPPGDHPRIRGEHDPTRPRTSCSAGSSPHTRGALLRLLGPDLHGGIIPAYAGSTCR